MNNVRTLRTGFIALAAAVLLAVGLSAPSGAATAAPAKATLNFHTSGDGEYGTRTPVGSFTYSARSDFYNYSGTMTSLIIFAKPGVSGTATGSYRFNGSSVSQPLNVPITPVGYVSIPMGFNGRGVAHVSLQLKGSDGTVQKVALDITVDHQLTPSSERSIVQGTVTQS